MEKALAIGVGIADNKTIDDINILQATKRAMRDALAQADEKLRERTGRSIDHVLFDAVTIDDVYLSSKVPFAYDYAEKKADVFPIESDHGTHVSGIIGGKSVPLSIDKLP